MGVENRKNAANALTYAKDHLNINPEIVVHDLSPNLISAVRDTYGPEKSAIDPFHVMQDVNRAITKDFSRIQKQWFTKEIKELILLRKFINDSRTIIKSGKSLQNALSTLPICSLGHDISIKCSDITKEVFYLLSIQKRTAFLKGIKNLITNLMASKDKATITFAKAIEKKLPKRAFTIKGYRRMVIDLLKKLKTLYLACRKPIEQEKVWFNKSRWALFIQPEKTSVIGANLILKLLRKYPELASYRDLTLAVGSIYRLPLKLVKNSLIDDLPIHKDWGKEVRACIKTLKRLRPEILRFREFFERNPDLPRRCRANMEYINVPINQVFKSGMCLKGMGRIVNELQQHIGGEVRNLLR